MPVTSEGEPQSKDAQTFLVKHPCMSIAVGLVFLRLFIDHSAEGSVWESQNIGVFPGKNTLLGSKTLFQFQNFGIPKLADEALDMVEGTAGTEILIVACKLTMLIQT